MSDTSLPDEWEQVKTEWDKTNQLGYEAVMQAVTVGQLLIDLKGDTKHGEFKKKVQRDAPFEYRTAANLMTLAKNKALLDAAKPDSQRAALKLIREAKAKATKPAPEPKVVLRLKQSDFDLIRGCLEAEGIPDELKEQFEQALGILDDQLA